MTTKKTSRPIKSKAPVKAIGRSAMRKTKGGVVSRKAGEKPIEF